MKSCSVNSFYTDTTSEVQPRFGFGSYTLTAVYIHNEPPHTVQHPSRYSFIYYIYIYTHTYIDIQNIYIYIFKEKQKSGDGVTADLKIQLWFESKNFF